MHYRKLYAHTFMHMHSEENPDGQTDAKKIFRYVDIMQSHRHKLVQYTYTRTYIHTLHLKADFLIPRTPQVSYDLNHFRP